MRIATWNVEYARPQRLDALRQVLADNPADIWVLTETHDELNPPGCPHPAHSEPRPQESNNIRPGSRWVSIWSRYPKLEKVSLPRTDRVRTVCALFDIGDGRTVLVYGTVLPWKGDAGKFDWTEHHRIIPEQCTEWQELRKRHRDSEFIVAGDFNTDMGTGGHYGTKQGIAALHAGLEACDLFCATTQNRLPPQLLTYPPIDHIAVPLAYKDSTSVVAAWDADKQTLSDHSGIVVEIPV